MRRILTLVITISALFLALAAPVAAATQPQPVKQSGTVESFYSQSTTCDSRPGQ